MITVWGYDNWLTSFLHIIGTKFIDAGQEFLPNKVLQNDILNI